MRLFLLGATGHTGRELLDLCLARGHDVTAFVRSPHKLEPRERLRVIAGDPKNTTELANAVTGHDAVLSAIGPAFREAMRPSSLCTDCAASTVAAMTRAGVQRLAIISAAVLFPLRGLQVAFFRWFLRHHARDLTSMEAVVTGSGLQWTIARPPRLVAAPTEQYRAQDGALPPRFGSIGFRGVAAFMLDAVERREHLGQIVGVAR